MAYPFLLLLAVAAALPSLVSTPWEAGGVPVVFKITVVDAQTSQPVKGARTLVWRSAGEGWRINKSNAGDISATTDAQGTCQVSSCLPGGGTARTAHLKVNSIVWVRADGYEPWRKPGSALLGNSVTVSDPFSGTNALTLKIPLTRKLGGA